MKTNRCVKVGPFVTFHFESSGEGRIGGETWAGHQVNSQRHELVATLTIEIDDPVRLDRELCRLAGIEETAYIALNQERIPGAPAESDDCTTADGKTSLVHRLCFRFIPEQIDQFKASSVEAVLGLAHPAYSHMTVIVPDVRADLARNIA